MVQSLLMVKLRTRREWSLIKTIDNGIMLRYEMFYEDLLCPCCGDEAGFSGEVCDVTVCTMDCLFKLNRWSGGRFSYEEAWFLHHQDDGGMFVEKSESEMNLILKVDISDVPLWYKCVFNVSTINMNQQYDNMVHYSGQSRCICVGSQKTL